MLVVCKDTEGTLKLTMDDKGEVTGFTVSGAATWVFASGDAAPLKGKVLPWTARATVRGPFPSTRRLTSSAKSHTA